MGESLQFLCLKDVFEREKQQGPASAGMCTVCGFGHLDGDAEQGGIGRKRTLCSLVLKVRQSRGVFEPQKDDDEGRSTRDEEKTGKRWEE